MRNRTAYDPTQAIGTDAFLDIVANLVGILLILIMVIGVRMDDASQNVKSTTASLSATMTAETTVVEDPQPEPPAIEIPDVAAAQRQVMRLESSVREAELEAARLDELAKIQKLDRDNLMLAVTSAEHELERRRAALDEQQRHRLAIDLKLQASWEEYQSLIQQVTMATLDAEQPAPEVIQHVATPMAKTVFVREEHFRLQQGRLVYVPLNTLTNRLRSEAPKKVWKLKNVKQITETIGPEDGFYLRYTLRRNRVPFPTGAGIAAREIVELDRFVMIPVSDLDGETVSEAMQEGSQFRLRLDGWSPQDTIITVWAYPDSFREFRELKRTLYDVGYLTAARPLPGNQLISGSPNGTRSAAQ